MQQKARGRGRPGLVATGDIEQNGLLLPVEQIGKRAKGPILIPQHGNVERALVKSVEQHFARQRDQAVDLAALARGPFDAP
ncbi:hypothetical protein D3C72_1333650 [compost metagenome]